MILSASEQWLTYRDEAKCSGAFGTFALMNGGPLLKNKAWLEAIEAEPILL